MNVRLAAITAKLTQHLHDVVQEFQVTEDELIKAIDFLYQIGQKNQYLLLSDVLGVSVLVDNITHSSQHHESATANSVEGPLYRNEAPLMHTPANICPEYSGGDILFMSGRILSFEDGRPLAHAVLDVWQTNEHGIYENEDPDQPDFNLRGRILSDENGKFEFRTIVPAPYEIGKTGPVGDLMKAIGRHSWRPAHIHFKVSADGQRTFTTQLFIPNDPWIDSDSIGAVKESLILSIEKCDSPDEMRKRGLDRPFYKSSYDFILHPHRM
ncbi:catechol 1,2-dioxygenase [Paenibacillus sp. yr247]|uniref:dioxygenase family protein n=1 Tax=Paenibacillus sp. yr247 TaxID=1761880 RepID=UPI0008838AFB|nr:dioxygenase [Paenibacillus sp. yr247]SDP16903.1 catechol 1,2-dioxygenase [Paenibacillus sp. yr247]